MGKTQQAKDIAKAGAPVVGAVALDIFNAATTIGAAAANAVQPGTGAVVGAGSMVAVGSFITVGRTIYEIAQNNKYCKKRSMRLAEGVAILCRAVFGLKETTAKTDNCIMALESTLETMNKCQEFVEIFKHQNHFIRILSSGAHKKRFDDLQQDLEECLSRLQAAFGAQIIINLEEAKDQIQLDLRKESKKLQQALKMQEEERKEELEQITLFIQEIHDDQEEQRLFLESMKETIEDGNVLLDNLFKQNNEFFLKQLNEIKAQISIEASKKHHNVPGAHFRGNSAIDSKFKTVAIGEKASANAEVDKLEGCDAVTLGVCLAENDNKNLEVALNTLEPEL